MAANAADNEAVEAAFAVFAAAYLLAEAIRHPWLSTVLRWRRVRTVRSYLRLALADQPSTAELHSQVYKRLRDYEDKARRRSAAGRAVARSVSGWRRGGLDE